VVAVRWFGSAPGEQVLQIPVDQIQVNPYQPRRVFEEEKLQELADSIRQMGVIQPIVVRRLGNVYELIAGERRWRAAMMANLKTIPGLVKEYTDQEVAQAALIENVQREDLGPLEEALAYQQLIAEFAIKQEELALRLGKSQSTIANKLRLLHLSLPVKELLGRGALNERQARALLRVKDEQEQLKLAEAAVAASFNVQQTEQMIAAHLAGTSVEQATAQAKRPLRKFIPKDVRIFLNTIRESVQLMRQAGISAVTEENESDDGFTIVIKIPRR
jgi:ParB family chromosome partitioning protein